MHPVSVISAPDCNIEWSIFNYRHHRSQPQEYKSFLPWLEVSTVHGQTVKNNGLTAYGRLLWIVNILGRQCFVNGASTVFQWFVNG